MLGGATFILAFAMQDSLGNIASGMMLMLNRPFDVGDFVSIGDVHGDVVAVGIAATTVTTPDNRSIVIPNSKVWGSVIVNASANATRRVDLVFDVDYGSDLTKVATILRDVAEAHPLTLSEPAAAVEIAELSENAVKILCRPWVRTPDYWRVRWDLVAAVKERFEIERIVIPYPHVEVRISGTPGRQPRETPAEAVENGDGGEKS
jgi:small conductance mechanosensitive channel